MATASSEAALKHLKRIKPLDGWSIERKSDNSSLVRLLRRNVPLTDNYFLDVHHDDGESGAVVGILTNPRNGRAQSQVLVDANGNLNGRKANLATVTTWKGATKAPSSSSTPSTSRSAAGARGSSTSSGSAAPAPLLSPEQNMELLTYAGYLIAGLVILKILFQTMFVLYILAFPIAYLYLVQTRPSDQSFDAKQQLKRVLRGQHLPEDHPDKPKGFLGETLARINASVATELATGLGYEVSLTTLASAATVAKVRVPTVNTDFYWLGAASRWTYVYSSEIKSENKAD